MEKNKKVVIIISALFTFLVVGCTAKPVLLKNTMTGEIVKCEASTGSVMMGGYIGSKINVKDCVKAYEKAGYRKID